MKTRALVLSSLAALTAHAQRDAGPPSGQFTFSAGVLPLEVGAVGAPSPGFEQALDLIDGTPRTASILTQAAPDAGAWFVYQLPAATTFTSFRVPDVHETPSAFQTFFRDIVVRGALDGPDAGFVELARATLVAPKRGKGEVHLTMAPPRAVRWVRVELSGGLDVRGPKSTLHFSELVGEGTQGDVRQGDGFTAGFRAKSDSLHLVQDGPVVSGCFDGEGTLSGTVTGPVLRARGVATRTGVVSLWVLQATAEGLRGVRSTNGAPFRVVELSRGTLGQKAQCPSPPKPKLSCGAVLHGLQFGYDSAVLLPGAEGLLDRLAAGLTEDGLPVARLEGHSSSEGDEAYNLELSRRRAEAVVAELVKRGVPSDRVTAAGRGESTPLASNDDEAGRSLNRRVEVWCR